MEEITQEEIDRVLAQAREENRKGEAIMKRRDEVVDEIQRLCDEYLQLKAGKIPERCGHEKPGYTVEELKAMLRCIEYPCDFCREIKKHSFPASLTTVTFGVSRTYPIVMNYCPECGRKL